MVNPVAFHLAGITVHWYGIIIASAILIGVWLAMREAKRRGIEESDTIIDLCLWAVPLAVIGGRLFYVIFEWQRFSTDLLSILYIWEGGLAIYGAVIGGALAVYIFSRQRKLGFVNLLDILAPSLVLGQAMGRWGNFFNQEAYGNLVTDPSMQWFPFAVFIQNSGPDGAWHLATFFYESVWCFLVFGFLFWYQKRQKRTGNVILWYFLLYGIERAFVEGLRTDSLWLIPDVVRVSQALSIVLVLAAGALLVYNNFYRKRPLSENKTDTDNVKVQGLR